MKFAIKAVAASLILAAAGGAFAQKGETVKIAWLDPLSGLMAAVGTNQLKSFQFISEEFNKKNASGVKFEIIGIDNISARKKPPAPCARQWTKAHGMLSKATVLARPWPSWMRWKSTTRATPAKKFCS